MTYGLETQGLGMRYRKHWALQECTVQIPRGCVAGLVGLNGAGKSTLIHLATAFIAPSTGTVKVLDEIPSHENAQWLARIGFVPQQLALYPRFSVQEMLTLGAKLNPGWDAPYARGLVQRLNIPAAKRIGELSGGQQAQVAMIMALAKRPDIFFLDEPLANMDPFVRREITKILMETVAERHATLLISSHIIADLDQICDHLVILSQGRIALAEEVEALTRSHKLLIGPRDAFDAIANTHTILQASHTGRQSSLTVRLSGALPSSPWQVRDMTLEEIVLAYLTPQQPITREQTPATQEVR